MQLISTKVYISPLPADFIPRPQLMARLGQVFRHKLTVISAPAGFGKTTLLGAWLQEFAGQSEKFLSCWLSLDAEDNGSGRFLEALLSSLEDTGIPLSTISAFLPITNTTNYRSMLKALVQDLSSLRDDVLLVLDDYHVIENQDVHELVNHLVLRAPPQLHILVSTRTFPPFEISKLRVSGQLLELGSDDLRFSLDETREYLRAALDFSFPEKDVVTIANKTEGWIAGLKMAALAMQKSENPNAFVKAFQGTHRYIFDYLMEQVLEQQPPDVKEFLVSTSIVETFNASLCDVLIQDGKHPPGTSREILSYLEKANLFIVPLDDERHWFRYHHLFSELLRSVLQQTTPHRVSILHSYAGDWYESNRMISDAVSHVIIAGDLERAAQMISENVLLLVEQTELKTVLHRLEALFSSGDVVGNPALKIAYAWVLAFSGQMNQATRVLQKIEVQDFPLAGSNNRNELLGNLHAAHAYIQWIEGYHSQAVELGKLAAEHLSTSNSAVQALNLTTLASVLLKLDRYEEALQIGQQAVEIGDAIDQPNVVMLAMTSLAYVYHDLGQIGKSSEICESALDRADEYRRKHGHLLPAAAGIYAIQAHNYYWQNDLEKAYWYAKRALTFSEVWGQVDFIFVAAWIMARVLSARHDLDAALKVVEVARRSIPQETDWTYYLTKLLEGFINFENENLERARTAASELAQFADKIQLDLANFYPHCELSIKVLIADGEYDKALNIIEQLLMHFKDNKGGYITNILVLQAWAFHMKWDEAEAISALETALQYAEPESHILPFVEAFSHLEGPLRNIAGRGIHTQILSRIFDTGRAENLRKDDGSSKEILPDVGGLVEPLTERELETLRLLNSYLSTPEIADMLAVSVNTVRTHIKNIYAKLGSHSRSTAITLAKELKLLS